MKKTALYIIIAALGLAGCMNIDNVNPYTGSLHILRIEPQYPDGFPDASKPGIRISVTDRNLGNTYSVTTGTDGNAEVLLPGGSYRIVMSCPDGNMVYNGAADNVVLTADRSLSLMVIGSRSGRIVIKELYFGGCQKYPEQGNYQIDKYIILHNNTPDVQYLDALCFGAVDPYNSASTNPWVTTDPDTGEQVFQDFVPVVQAVWQFPGDGDDFPLQPGEDAVLCLTGAINHLAQYPNSVNLNKPDYFVCYNTTYFPNTAWHPAPGDRIRQDHILNCVIKTGIANAYAYSSISPATIIFRTPEDITILEFVSNPDNVVQKPGSTVDKVVAVPLDWVMDGVEVFNGAGSKKRLPSVIDAGSIQFSESFQGHSVLRRTNESATDEFGYEVLEDTNNSANDFVEIAKHTLNE